MKKFQYQIVRYIHDQITGEFVNVGIIVFHPESNFLKAKFIKKYHRISQFFKNVNGDFLVSTLRNFNQELNIENNRLGELFTDYSSLESITSSILPKDDSALVCSSVFQGIDLDLSKATEDLFDRLVNEYFHEPTEKRVTDSYVWKKKYKRYFDRLNITPKLTEYKVSTPNDQIVFENTWRNGSLNVFQSLSLNLKRIDAIKNKAYKWSGILSELEQSNENLSVYFLTNNPTSNPDISDFVNDTLSKHESDNLKIRIVKEEDAEQFAFSVKNEMEKAH